MRSLAAHLDRASPEVKAAVEAVLDTLAQFGPHSVIPVKTMIVVKGARNFAGLTVRHDSADLGIFLPRQLTHRRIHKTERVGPSKYAHHTRLASAAEVDKELKAWLREAYDIGTA